MSTIVGSIDTGFRLDYAIETTGYDGGDSSITTLSIHPFPGFQHKASIFSIVPMYSELDGVISTDDAAQISFQVRGDIELNALRKLLREASSALDELLEES